MKLKFELTALLTFFLLPSCSFRTAINCEFVFDEIFRLYAESDGPDSFSREDTTMTLLSSRILLFEDKSLEMTLQWPEGYEVFAEGLYRINMDQTGHSGDGYFNIHQVNGDNADLTIDVEFSNSWDLYLTIPESMLPNPDLNTPLLDFRRWGS